MSASLYDLSPLVQMLVTGALLASGPIVWVALRHRRSSVMGRIQALTLVTLFLTFDLVLFGAFTRLTDSGLGCPDWPGCYGHASPLGAGSHIDAAQTAMPDGPVTHGKAWVEMVHRYLATTVGALIAVLAGLAWWARKGPHQATAPSPAWPMLTLVWVCIQGAFGALTVTMKLFPAIVSLHLLGGYVLLALLVWQAVPSVRPSVSWVPDGVRRWVALALAVVAIQAASGAWVSTNYAVLACTDFPTCHGGWWPLMDFERAFEIWRPLGLSADGVPISFQALTAIHYAHRMLALITLTVLAGLVWYLNGLPSMRRHARVLLALLGLQLATGVGNVVFGWPLLVAVLHTGGAGALVVALTWALAVARSAPRPEPAASPYPRTTE